MGSEARVNCCGVFECSSEQSHHLYLTIRLDRLAQLPLQSPHLHTRRTHSARDTEQSTGIGHRSGVWMHEMQQLINAYLVCCCSQPSICVMQLEHQQSRRRSGSNECQLVEARLWHCNASCELAEAPASNSSQ